LLAGRLFAELYPAFLRLTLHQTLLLDRQPNSIFI
jgi:hypothetical protein